GPVPIPGFAASPDVARLVKSRAAQLLAEGTADQPHPAALLEVPDQRKVLLIQLAGVASGIPDDERWQHQLIAVLQYEMQLQEQLAQDWFTYDAVASRLQYSEDAGKGS